MIDVNIEIIYGPNGMYIIDYDNEELDKYIDTKKEIDFIKKPTQYGLFIWSGKIDKNDDMLYISGKYNLKNPIETYIDNGIDHVDIVDGVYKCCKCDEKAVWMYTPSDGDFLKNSFYCDNHVPRGCSCENLSIEDLEMDKLYNIYNSDEFIDCLSGYNIIDRNYEKYKDYYFRELDSKGREYPCVEYWYDKEGFSPDI